MHSLFDFGKGIGRKLTEFAYDAGVAMRDTGYFQQTSEKTSWRRMI